MVAALGADRAAGLPGGFQREPFGVRTQKDRLACSLAVFFVCDDRIERGMIIRFGGDLLSHVLRRSTIGATALNCRVRDGTGCFARAMTTKPRKYQQACSLLDFLG